MEKGIFEKRIGKYIGNGINHEGQPFTGTFELKPVLNSRGFRILYSAIGSEGQLFHQEESILALSDQGKWTLWNFNTNSPGLLPHVLALTATDSDSTRLVFSFGDLTERNSFRETVTLTFWVNRDLSYLYSWGLPGGEFTDRSGLRMQQAKAIS